MRIKTHDFEGIESKVISVVLGKSHYYIEMFDFSEQCPLRNMLSLLYRVTLSYSNHLHLKELLLASKADCDNIQRGCKTE